MMTTDGILLDTNVALLALARPSALSSRVRNAVLSGPNVLSVVVYWEVALKLAKGTLVVGHPHAWWRDALDMLGATELPIGSKHVEQVHELPGIHRDPFDRM